MKLFKNLQKLVKFSNFLKKNLKNDLYCKENNKQIILVEYFKYKASFMPFYYFAKNLQIKDKSTIKLYYPKILSAKNKFSIFFDKIFFLSIYNFFEILGVNEIILPRKFNVKKTTDKILKNLSSRKDILEIKIDNILIGDLIYDEYLRTEDLVTIDLNSIKFKNHLEKSIGLFFYWKNFLEKNNVKSIIYSHATYLIGLLPRIAIYKNVSAYKVGPANAYKTNKKNMYTFDDRKNYKKIFNLFSNKLRKKYLDYAKKNLLIQFLGKKPNENFIKKVIKKKKTNKIKVLVSSHCFNDAVHIFGKFIFNDFHEWIEFLAKFSQKSSYKWYIKIHPGEYDRNINKVYEYKKKFSNLNILPKNFTNEDVLKLNINAVLTVYGSVGREYPIFNIPVINASKNNPHSEYNFNYHASSKAEYLKMLNNLGKLKINPYKCREDIYKYYALKYSNYNIIDDFRSSILKVKYKKGGKNFKQIIEDNVLDKFVDNFSFKRHEEINFDIARFIRCKHIRMIADNTNNYSKYIDL